MSRSTTPSRYSPLMVAFHWLTVLLVFAAFVAGKFVSRIPNDDASKLAPLAIHMIIGILTLLTIVARFVVRMRTPQPAYASTGSALLDGLGKFAHYALYLFVFLIAASGMSLSIQAGLPQTVFGGNGSLPADFFDFAARALHGFIAPALFLLILLHIGAAFYHQFALKDNLFARMRFGK
ncbi:MAG: Cytochrome b561 [Anaerolineales bacterium]|nr:Cytochrome b561 [Anaerolineales bacterium]